MSGHVLGIDLGTTNSVVAVADGEHARVLADEEGRRLIPSVVSFTAEGTILVGTAARERRLLDARNTIYSVKRLIGRPFKSREVKRAQERFPFTLSESPNGGVFVQARGESYTLTEVSAYVLREIRRIAELSLGQKADRAVITVPANFNELQRSATKAAGRVAGLDVARIINEPTAAALAYGHGTDRAARVAVYDLGGGTFDITILELENDVFEVVATAGDTFLGGDDVDLLVAEAMADACRKELGFDPKQDPQAFERVRAAAEWLKCKLSEADDVEVRIEELGFDAGGRPVHFAYRLRREALESMAQGLVDRSFQVTSDALREAGLKAGDVDAVILVGGSTRMPLVRRRVANAFGKQPLTAIDPDLVVAQGAAVHARALAGRDGEPVQVRKLSPREVQAAQKRREEASKGRPRQPAFAPAPAEGDPRPPPPIGRGDARPPPPPAPRGDARPPAPPPPPRPSPPQPPPPRPSPPQPPPPRPSPPQPPPPSPPTPPSPPSPPRTAASPGPLELSLPDESPEPKRPAPKAGTPAVRISAIVSVLSSPIDEPTRIRDTPADGVQDEIDALLFEKPAALPADPDVDAVLFAESERLPADPEIDAVLFDEGEPAEPQEPTGVMARPELETLRFDSDAPAAARTAPYMAPVLDTPLDDAAPAEPTGVMARPHLEALRFGREPAPPAPALDLDELWLGKEQPLPPGPPGSGTEPDVAAPRFESSPAHAAGGLDAAALFDSDEQVESSIKIDDGYAAEVESVRPGGISTGTGIDIVVDEAALSAPAVPRMPPPPPPAPPQARGGQPPPPPPRRPATHDPFGLEALLPPDPERGAAVDALAPLDFGDPARPSSHPPAPAGVLPLRGAAPPLLMDVTPHSLGLETVGGFCQHVIRRNAPIPAEQTRLFTTAHDGQESVRTRICQGESRAFPENQLLGEIELTGLRKAERGQVRIEVSFIIDANGTLDVTAKDLDTGRAQRIRINLLGGYGEAELRDMIERQAAFG